MFCQLVLFRLVLALAVALAVAPASVSAKPAHAKQKAKSASAKKAKEHDDAPPAKALSAKAKREQEKLTKHCADKKNRKSAACKKFLVQAENSDEPANGKKDKKAGKNAAAKAGKDDDDQPEPLTAKEKKKNAALAKTCAGKAAKKSEKCKNFFAEQKDRADAVESAKTAKFCAIKANKRTKACKIFLAKNSGGTSTDACGRKHGTARKNEKVAKFAKRFHIAEATLRSWNDISGSKLKGGKRYLVAKSPHDGMKLEGGVALEDESGHVVLRRPLSAFGKPLLVDAIRLGAQQARRQYPDATTLVVGDLSREHGGCFPPHRSHRGGIDADIGFFFRGARQPSKLEVATVETLDADRTWLFLRVLLATGKLQFAFIEYGLQPALYDAALRAGQTPDQLDRIFQVPRPFERAHETVIRHLHGHDNHMHVRVICGDNPECALGPEQLEKIAAVRLDQAGGVVRERQKRPQLLLNVMQ